MPVDCADFEALCEFALHYLLTAKGDARRLAAELVLGHPALPVLEIVLILSSAASGLETVFSDAFARHHAQETWRMAALLAVDLHLTEGGRTAADLLDYWRREDDFFLKP